MSIVILSVFSLFLGLIINIVASRVPKGEEDVSWVWPFCSSCNRKLTITEMLVPVNFFMHKGKCKECSKKVFSRPLQITLFTLVVCISLFLKFGFTIEFFAFLFLMSVLIGVFFIDLDYFIIPSDLLIAALCGSLLVFVYNIFYEFPIYMDRAWWNPLIGGASIAILLIIIAVVGYYILKTEAMGLGDVKLFVPTGIFLGWRMVIVAFVLSAIIGSIVSIAYMLIKGIGLKKREPVPFGPGIVLGTLTTILFGIDILNWYLQFSFY